MNKIEAVRNDEDAKICIPNLFGFRFKDVVRWKCLNPNENDGQNWGIRIWFYNAGDSVFNFESRKQRMELDKLLIDYFLNGHLAPLELKIPEFWNEYDNYIKSGGMQDYNDWVYQIKYKKSL